MKKYLQKTIVSTLSVSVLLATACMCSAWTDKSKAHADFQSQPETNVEQVAVQSESLNVQPEFSATQPEYISTQFDFSVTQSDTLTKSAVNEKKSAETEPIKNEISGIDASSAAIGGDPDEPNGPKPAVTFKEEYRYEVIYARMPVCSYKLHDGTSPVELTNTISKEYKIEASLNYAINVGIDWASLTKEQGIMSYFKWSEKETMSFTTTNAMPMGKYRIERFVKGKQYVKYLKEYRNNQLWSTTVTVVAEYAPDKQPDDIYGLVGYDVVNGQVIYLPTGNTIKTFLAENKA